MVFIPDPSILAVGDRIRLTKPVSIFVGTFSVGHEFNIIGQCERGWEVKDDDGNYIREIGLHDKCVKVSNV